MTEIRLTITLPARQRLAVQQALNRRYTRGFRAEVTGFTLAAVFLATALGAAAVADIPTGPALFVAAVTLFAVALAWHLLARAFARGQIASIASSALHALPSGVVLSAKGIALDARQFRWDQTCGTTRLPGATLVDFSALSALVIPDTALPPGLTPEALATQIAAWKSA